MKRPERYLIAAAICFFGAAVFMFPLSKAVLPITDQDVRETIGFLLMFLFAGLGLSVLIAALGLLVWRYQYR